MDLRVERIALYVEELEQEERAENTDDPEQ